MNNVGLYIYRIEVIDKTNHEPLKTLASGQGAMLEKFLPHFINGKQTPTSATERERSWSISPTPSKALGSYEGLIKYGTFGMSSEIIDPSTGGVLLDRKGNHVEQIDLYYQYYFPQSKPHVALIAIQSYKAWSCVELANGALGKEFRDFSKDALYLKFSKIMPTELAVYANREVKKITLVRKGVATDDIDALTGINGEEIDLQMTYSTRRRKSFGRLSDVSRLLNDNATQGLLQMSEEFEATRATAMVSVGKSLRKVGVIGPAVNAGVIDISDDVTFGANDHPKFSSISKVTSDHLADFAQIL